MTSSREVVVRLLDCLTFENRTDRLDEIGEITLNWLLDIFDWNCQRCSERALTLWFEAYDSDIFALVTTTITSGVQEVGMGVDTGPVLRKCSAHYWSMDDRVR